MTGSVIFGAYALCILCRDFPDQIVCTRWGSPLVLGVCGEVSFIASDAHDPNQLDARLDETYRIVADKYGAEYANAIFWHMPRVLLGLERD
ncbi:MAG: hypothetical protein J6P88_04345 [Clostridia bacterium]|nr:hypothetical protein [Clostridia bacterium]